MKIGIVDVGGGLRGIYAAGVLDFVWTRVSGLMWESVCQREAQIWNPTQQVKRVEIISFIPSMRSENSI